MLIKIQVDNEKAKSLLEMAERTEKSLKLVIKTIGLTESSSLIAREYYEVIRELSTAILILDGLKSVGDNAHKETIDNLSKHNKLSQDEIHEMQDLRIKRNKNSYEGKPIEAVYLENKKHKLDIIIGKLKEIVRKKIK